MSNTHDIVKVQIIFTSGQGLQQSLELYAGEYGLIKESSNGPLIFISSLLDLQELRQNLPLLDKGLAYLKKYLE